VEFLLDDDGGFYFLEMNTRLQVEHPVTEMVTGIDLVAWQLSVAQGEPLPMAQEGLRLRGHAIEARLYAEDPAAGFLPQVGRIEVWEPSPAIRVDAGVESGSEVSSFYDPMLAKLVAWGHTREDARRRLVGALQHTHCLGLQTNRAFLLELLASEAFADGEIKTDTIDARSHEAPQPSALDWAIAAALAVRAEDDRWRSTGHASWTVTLVHRDEERTLLVEGQDRLRVGEIELRFDGDRVEHDGVWRTIRYARVGGAVHLDEFSFVEPAGAGHEDPVAGDRVVAPITGRVVRVEVAAGDAVEAGQTLVVLEAMKMEHRVQAPRAGTVASVDVAVDDQVDGGKQLCALEEA
jgi:geranyl-CoA carboxylase alpha subunit